MTTTTPMLDLQSFRQVARHLDPEARIVPVRGLRRVIRRLRDLDEFGSRAPHDLCLRIPLSQLSQHLAPSELGIVAADEAPMLLLIPAPDVEASREVELRRLWRTLFHAAIDRTFDELLARGTIGRDRIEHFILQWGPAQWAEIRHVLAEDYRIGPDDNATIFREFVTHYLELTQFQPHDLHAYYPGLHNVEGQLDWLLPHFDASTLAAQLRPEGLVLADPHAATLPTPEPVLHGTASETVRHRAELASANGNDVRAAVTLLHAHDARYSIYRNHLGERLAKAFGQAAEALEWINALRPLFAYAAEGVWSLERRVLYQLQQACLNLEKDHYAIDVSEWVMTLGKQRIKRQLVKPRWLYALRHLRTAVRQLDSSRLTPSERARFDHLLQLALAKANQRARADLRPELLAVFDAVGLVPANVAERVSRAKAIEELLDTAVEKGMIRIGDLRDAIARNRVKLPDLQGPGEFIWGDALLRANSQLAVKLDGVYRRGEIYMRLLQRGCSLFFGTKVGRVLTKYLALPLGGAYVVIEGFKHAVEAVEGAIHWLTGPHEVVAEVAKEANGNGVAEAVAVANQAQHYEFLSTLGIVAACIFLLLHWPACRRTVIHVLQLLLFKAPKAIAQSPLTKFVFNNQVTRFFKRHLLIPFATGGTAFLIAHFSGATFATAWWTGGIVALLFMLLAYTAFGRGIEDRMGEAAERAWRILSVNFIMGLFALVQHFFQWLVGVIDRGFYAVDEWLRFRSGESRMAFVFKLLFGTFWLVLTYVFRFAWNLLVEPQINPIKHFPVVTVSHKMLLPLIPSLAKQFNQTVKTMTTVVFGIPGIFGFMVWELKENWKLYRANAPATLRPLVIGSHGEKMRALLRPGFHSGVVPKTFGKWRRALQAGNFRRAAKMHHHLHHVAEGVERFVERELIALLKANPRWGGMDLSLEHVELATNGIRVPLYLPNRDANVVLSFEERGGWVIASITEPGWLPTLTTEQQHAFRTALLGLYKFAGVHVVREQVAAELGPQAYRFDAVPEGLLIQHEGKVKFFDYDDGPELLAAQMKLPTATTVLSAAPVAWDDWWAAWEPDAEAKPLLPEWSLLPSTPSDPTATTPAQG